MDFDLKNEIVLSSISGVLLGLAAFFVKIAVITSGSMLMIILNPMGWLAAILGLAGFFILQKSLYRGAISRAVPIMGGLSIVIPVILANLFLNEFLGLKIIAVLLIAAGVFSLAFSSRK